MSLSFYKVNWRLQFTIKHLVIFFVCYPEKWMREILLNELSRHILLESNMSY
jgi:hypothetical protein